MRYYHERRDYKEALKISKIACENLHDAGMCYNSGLYNYKAMVGVKDAKTAAVYYEFACKYGNVSGCKSLGALYVQGEGVAADLTFAKFYYNLACERGDSYSCSFIKSLSDE